MEKTSKHWTDEEVNNLIQYVSLLGKKEGIALFTSHFERTEDACKKKLYLLLKQNPDILDTAKEPEMEASEVQEGKKSLWDRILEFIRKVFNGQKSD